MKVQGDHTPHYTSEGRRNSENVIPQLYQIYSCYVRKLQNSMTILSTPFVHIQGVHIWYERKNTLRSKHFTMWVLSILTWSAKEDIWQFKPSSPMLPPSGSLILSEHFRSCKDKSDLQDSEIGINGEASTLPVTAPMSGVEWFPWAVRKGLR